MQKLSLRSWLGGALVVLLLVAIALLAVRARHLPPAPPHAARAADLSSLPRLRVSWVEYARNETLGQAASADITRMKSWEITVAGLLVRHPRGDLVVDVGNSRRYAEEIADYPFLGRAWLKLLPGSNTTVAAGPDALVAAGANPDDLTVVLSHMHVDHAGGLVDLPRARVLLAPEELAFAQRLRDERSIHVVPAHARALDGRARAIAFTREPYETFDESADVFGDGSVVVVPLRGHTPGSVGVFVNVSPELRLFHVGDAVNIVEAIPARLTKSVVMASTDNTGAEADRVVSRIAQLHEAKPEIVILPAHDRVAWARVFGEPNRWRD